MSIVSKPSMERNSHI